MADLSLRIVARHQEKIARDLYARLFEAMSLQDAKRVLGFPPTASPTPEEIAKAYKHKAIENHPDRGGDHTKMVEINVAKDILDGKQRPEGGPSVRRPTHSPQEREEAARRHEEWRKKREERAKLGDSFAEAKAKAPHGVTWKFRSGLMMGKESAFTKEQGLNSYVACWVCYGQSASQHVFMLVEHAVPNQFTDGPLFDSWSMSQVETYPLSHDLAKLAPKAIKSIASNGKLTSGVSKLATKFMGMEALTEAGFEHGSGGVALKDILIGLGFASGAASDRKVVVEMVGKRNEAKVKASRAKGERMTTLDAWQWYDFTLFVNGKPYPLSEATVANLARQGSHGNLFWLAVYSPVKYDYGQRRVLTKIPRYGSKILEMVEESLSGEPADLTVSLLKAIETMESPKTAQEHPETGTMDPLALKVAARFSDSRSPEDSELGMPYRVAARQLQADMGVEAPKKVDDLFDEVKKGNPDYSDEQAWATAWSIYCKHVDPNGTHCTKSPGDYLKSASTLKKIPPYAGSTRWVVMDGDKEIGLVEKARSTRTDLLPYKAFAGIGHEAKFIGAFYDAAEAKKWGYDENRSRDHADMKWGGMDAAVKAVEHAAH